MTTDELTDRVQVLMELGCVCEVGTLLWERCNDRPFVERLKTASSKVRDWAFWASPVGSVMSDEFAIGPEVLSFRLQEQICGVRQELAGHDS